jgi:hypothetical protein
MGNPVSQVALTFSPVNCMRQSLPELSSQELEVDDSVRRIHG